MKLFACQGCNQPIYFENTVCITCGHRLGYLPERFELCALVADGTGWRPLSAPSELRFFCANAADDVCNWMTPPDGSGPYCVACRHNQTIPPLMDDSVVAAWRKIETAKRWLFYSLMRFGLPLTSRAEDPGEGLAFDFRQDEFNPDGSIDPVLTGHERGVITINVAEADEAEREKRRTAMGEPYRTLLGHMRHEIAHWYWDRLVRDRPAVLERSRGLFGDDRADYAQALQWHYANGPVPGWQNRYVSSYAASHPWEDFAETWAHYFHTVDTLETARSFGIQVRPRVRSSADLDTEVEFDPYHNRGVDELMEAWLPLTLAVNSLNRSMGQPDLYPFILNGPVLDKLAFVRDIIRDA